MKKVFFFVIGLLFWPVMALREGYAYLSQERERYRRFKIFLWREILISIKFFVFAALGMAMIITTFYFLKQEENFWPIVSAGGYLLLGIMIGGK